MRSATTRSTLPALLALAALAACKQADEPRRAAPTGGSPVAAAPAPNGGELKVAGASDLVFAMEELGPRFTQETGTKIVFIPGSSGKLAEQIKQGAPFDVFLSANMKFVDDAIAAGACLADTRAYYALGRVVLWTREAGPALPHTLDGVVDPKFGKIALAQPDHAPYGAAAKAALEKLGVYDTVSRRLVYGSNIKDTMQMAESGSADVALIALALVRKGGGRYIEVPAELHPPIEQGMAACKARNEVGARRFVEFMRSPSTQELLETYGFGIPGPEAGNTAAAKPAEAAAAPAPSVAAP